MKQGIIWKSKMIWQLNVLLFFWSMMRDGPTERQHVSVNSLIT